ncbi:MAG: hypothetical protein GTO03_10145, partial [Planctomycetales bacterium]|nr:hypothetical protein [Planctomycetales bacterium]
MTDVVGPATALAGNRIDVQWTVRNEGLADATGSGWVDRVFLREAGGDPDGPTIELGRFFYTLPLAAGKSYSRAEQFRLPSTLTGVFQILVTTNRSNTLFEPNRANNTAAAGEVLTVALPPRPDLQVLDITAPQTVVAGGAASLEFVVINQGAGPTTTPNWTDRVYLSLDNRVSSDDAILGSLTNGAALGPGEQYRTQTGLFEIPKRFGGAAFLIVQADAGNQVEEFPNENNNTQVFPVDVTPLPPSDLVTSQVIAPDLAFDGSTIEVRYTVTNLGSGETDRDRWTDTIWLARDRRRPSPQRFTADGIPFGKGDVLLQTVTHTGSLAVGDSYDVVTQVVLPQRDTGEFFITPWSDAYDVVTENTFATNVNPDDPNEIDNNNYKARPITVLLTPPPDLVVTSVAPDAAAVGGQPFTVSWTVTNQGRSRTEEDRWTDTIYLSDAPLLGAESVSWQLGKLTHEGALGSGESYTATATFELSPAASGQFVIVDTNAGRTAFEGPLTDNNRRAAPTNVVTPPAADLRVSTLVTPDLNFSGEAVTLTWTVQNVGATVWEGTRFWTDRVQLTPDPVFNSSRVLASRDYTIALDQPL